MRSATTAPVPTADSDRPKQERRHSPRILTTLPATITVESATWDGTISNLSLGGACVTLPGDFPAVRPQDAYVVVKTAVGILELQGRAQERSISLQTKTPASQLIVTFEPPKPKESAVLASLVQAAQEQTGTGQQNQCQSQLDHDERRSKTPFGGACRGFPVSS